MCAPLLLRRVARAAFNRVYKRVTSDGRIAKVGGGWDPRQFFYDGSRDALRRVGGGCRGKTGLAPRCECDAFIWGGGVFLLFRVSHRSP